MQTVSRHKEGAGEPHLPHCATTTRHTPDTEDRKTMRGSYKFYWLFPCRIFLQNRWKPILQKPFPHYIRTLADNAHPTTDVPQRPSNTAKRPCRHTLTRHTTRQQCALRHVKRNLQNSAETGFDKKNPASVPYQRCHLLPEARQPGHFQIFSILRFSRPSFLFYPKKQARICGRALLRTQIREK